MKWSKAKRQMVLKLQEIERARKRAAEARLLDARTALDDAERAKGDAETELAGAERSWRGYLQSPGFNVELSQALSAQLLDQQRALEAQQDDERRAKRRLDEQVQVWRRIEASVTSVDRHIGLARRAAIKRTEDAREQELAERTTWKWFSR
jgi:hypothetical protein